MSSSKRKFRVTYTKVAIDKPPLPDCGGPSECEEENCRGCQDYKLGPERTRWKMRKDVIMDHKDVKWNDASKIKGQFVTDLVMLHTDLALVEAELVAGYLAELDTVATFGNVVYQKHVDRPDGSTKDVTKTVRKAVEIGFDDKKMKKTRNDNDSDEDSEENSGDDA